MPKPTPPDRGAFGDPSNPDSSKQVNESEEQNTEQLAAEGDPVAYFKLEAEKYRMDAQRIEASTKGMIAKTENETMEEYAQRREEVIKKRSEGLKKAWNRVDRCQVIAGAIDMGNKSMIDKVQNELLEDVVAREVEIEKLEKELVAVKKQMDELVEESKDSEDEGITINSKSGFMIKGAGAVKIRDEKRFSNLDNYLLEKLGELKKMEEEKDLKQKVATRLGEMLK